LTLYIRFVLNRINYFCNREHQDCYVLQDCWDRFLELFKVFLGLVHFVLE
jgi:hypothetical protein